jgi:DnaJ domain
MRPGRSPFDPYAALGLAPGATKADVRRAYRRRALSVHPDVTGTDSTEEMTRLNDARDELLSTGSSGRRPSTEGPVASAREGAGRPERPSWAAAHEAAWTDYWSAWNELPKRARATDSAAPGTPKSGREDS